MTPIEKITKRTKQLQRKHPNTPWAELRSKATREYHAGALGRTHHTKKKTARKKKASKTVAMPKRTHTTHKSHSRKRVSGGTINHHKAAIKEMYERRLADLYIRHTNATTKMAKRKIAKEMRTARAALRKYQ